MASRPQRSSPRKAPSTSSVQLALGCFQRRSRYAGAGISPPFLGTFQSPSARAGALGQGPVQTRRILVSVVRVFFQTAENDPLQVGGHPFLELMNGNEGFVSV